MTNSGVIKEIHFSQEGIGHALSDRCLSVPTFQRSYAWEDKHVLDLFNDLESSIKEYENEYFFGSIVVIRGKNKDRDFVVDGQQRLATTAILIASIRNHFFDTGEKDIAKDIEREFLIDRDRRSRDEVSKIILNETDHDFFLKTILLSPDKKVDIQPTKESHKRILNAADLAEKHVEKLLGSTKKSTVLLHDWLDYLKNRVKVIWVMVADDANAFMIFETLNDRGLDLAITDLLKNYLFGLSMDRISEVQQRWISMYGALEAVDSENMAVTYIRQYWSSKYGMTREKELYSRIKSKIHNKTQAVDFAGELSGGARMYAAMLNPDHDYWNPLGTKTRQHMATLNLLRMSQIRPLILSILSEFSDKEIKKSLKLMVSWAVRFLIVGGLGGGFLETNYCARAKEIREGVITRTGGLIEAMKSVVPNDRQFKEAFSIANVSKQYLARYYLRALEKVTNGVENPELLPNPDEQIVTLEHVWPENPSKEWGAIDPETSKAYWKRIGNMALMHKKPNERAANKGFSAKKTYYKESELLLTRSIANYNDWGIRNIEDRQKELADLAIKAWPYKG